MIQTMSTSWQQQFDPFGLQAITRKAALAWWKHPEELAASWQEWWQQVGKLNSYAAARCLGTELPPVCPPQAEDERFKDPAWQELGWDLLKQWYLLNTHWLQDALYRTPELSDKERSRSAFWLRQGLNALAPNNFFLTNPVAQRKAQESGGKSLSEGWRNFLRDAARGDIAMTDLSAFQVGKNLATTPGAVVYRGRLLEVIHYEATTPTVKQIPVVIVSPWINKYYVLDLDNKKSLIQYLVSQGFSVFVTSWKNPGPDDKDVGFDDYITEGIDRIVQVAKDIQQSEQVLLTGYCIGGTLTTVYLAWLAAQKRGDEVAGATLLTTLTDFSRPGDIEVFLDEEGLSFVERKMQAKGYLDGKDMAASFRMLRANSLIWNYWVENYLFGETPQPFDILYWNMDSTRMPCAMHSFYLREFYLHNKLIQPNALTIAGQKIDLRKIKTPLFMVSAEEDHIAPWKQTWHLTEHTPHAPVKFTLSSSGHILGIVNPPKPNSKRRYWQGDVKTGEPHPAWFARQEPVNGSWWPSWVNWMNGKAEASISPQLTSNRYPAICPAPGRYVLEH